MHLQQRWCTRMKMGKFDMLMDTFSHENFFLKRMGRERSDIILSLSSMDYWDCKLPNCNDDTNISMHAKDDRRKMKAMDLISTTRK